MYSSSIQYLMYYIVIIMLVHARTFPRILTHNLAYPRIPAHARAYSRMPAHTRAYPRILRHTGAWLRILAQPGAIRGTTICGRAFPPHSLLRTPSACIHCGFLAKRKSRRWNLAYAFRVGGASAGVPLPERSIWYLDNTAALMSLIRGRSDNPDLSKMPQLIHLCLFTYQCWVYWEWVPSKSNWIDAISREDSSDPWHQANHFSTFSAHFPFELWALTLGAAVKVFEFL